MSTHFRQARRDATAQYGIVAGLLVSAVGTACALVSLIASTFEH